MVNNAYPMTRKDKLIFDNGQGKQLAGILERPAAEPNIFALFAHCFTCTKDILAASRISRALASEGIGVFRFDFTGLGDSEGSLADTTLSTHMQDIIGAADYLRERFMAPKLLIGHSLGGVAVLSTAKAIPEATAVVTIAAPSDPECIGRLFEEEALENNLSNIGIKEHSVLESVNRRIADGKGFLAEVSAPDFSSRLEQAIRGMGKALLVLHSPRDEIVDLYHARAIFEAALHPKSFVSLDSADHLLTRQEDAQYAAEIIKAWAGKYARPSAASVSDAPEIGEVRVTEVDGRFSQEVRTNRHSFLADEPIDYGGADTGPSPYELLLAGLGACTAMTIRMYANHKKLPLERISVLLDHEKIDARSCPECTTQKGKVDRITREIQIKGDLTPEQRKRIVAIANRCPVHKTIHGEIDDQAWLAEEESG
uniref:Putative redox protein n=1 Tax=Candidatus Kentrum sp. UNK TaxID=2126344 RepID=A0A450ZXW5_9GAMM|nr:MAG: putative redox protein [Candidatus Kentron sp. UNK]VFK68498.1 MAG: putative redox protein [Candidatus Kentron sp. UNK]